MTGKARNGTEWNGVGRKGVRGNQKKSWWHLSHMRAREERWSGQTGRRASGDADVWGCISSLLSIIKHLSTSAYQIPFHSFLPWGFKIILSTAHTYTHIVLCTSFKMTGEATDWMTDERTDGWTRRVNKELRGCVLDSKSHSHQSHSLHPSLPSSTCGQRV